jgi:hypothetical protein
MQYLIESLVVRTDFSFLTKHGSMMYGGILDDLQFTKQAEPMLSQLPVSSVPIFLWPTCSRSKASRLSIRKTIGKPRVLISFGQSRAEDLTSSVQVTHFRNFLWASTVGTRCSKQ